MSCTPIACDLINKTACSWDGQAYCVLSDRRIEVPELSDNGVDLEAFGLRNSVTHMSPKRLEHRLDELAGPCERRFPLALLKGIHCSFKVSNQCVDDLRGRKLVFQELAYVFFRHS